MRKDFWALIANIGPNMIPVIVFDGWDSRRTENISAGVDFKLTLIRSAQLLNANGKHENLDRGFGLFSIYLRC